MAEKTNTEIFLPLTFNKYKENKINLLKVQLKTVNGIERIKKLESLRKLKSEQRHLLKTIIKEIKQSHQKLLKSLPKAEETKTHKIDSKRIETHKMPTQREYQTNSRIDEELDRIQEKLKNLKL